MRLKGKTYKLPIEELVFQRGDDFIYFKLQGITSLEEYDAIVVKPQPPTISEPGRPVYQDLQDPKYIQAAAEYSKQQIDYLVIKALSATEGLEWETVSITDPHTWSEWRNELLTLGLTHYEVEQVATSALRVHGATGQTKSVRDAFLAYTAAQAQKAAEAAKSSQTGEPSPTAS